MTAVAECVPATGDVLIRFPFYAVIFGMIVGTGISDWLARLFAALTTYNTFPLLVVIYSAVLGVFIPSELQMGDRGTLRAPSGDFAPGSSGMGSADLHAAEAQPNLVNPFFGCCRCWEFSGSKPVTLSATDCCSFPCICPSCFFFAGSSPARWRIRFP
jgi:short-chain fatty acids transporter